MKNRTIRILIIVLVFILTLACGKKQSDWAGNIKIIEGVTVIENPMEPMYPDGDTIVSIEEEMTIKGDTEIEERMFSDIRTLDIDSEGNIFILDEQAGNIKVFDAKGKFLKTFGRKGHGPGEFGLPISIHITGEQEIIINDMGRRVLSIFDHEGNYIKQISIADKFLFFGPRTTAGGFMIASHLAQAEKPRNVLKIFDKDLETAIIIASVTFDRIPAINVFIARSLSALIWNVNSDEEIIWGSILNPAYELNVHNIKGQLIRKIKKNYTPIAITAEDKKTMTEKMFGPSNPSQDQWNVKFPPHYPPVAGISCDDEGRTFVKTHEERSDKPGGIYDVFDKQGRFIAKVNLDKDPMILKKGKFYTIEEDEEGYRFVKVYKILWTY